MGGSCVGKDTVLKMLYAATGIRICISNTTRTIREGEQQGKEYNFITEKEFLHGLSLDQYVEYRKYKTKEGIWYYGLPKIAVNPKVNQFIIVDQGGYYTLINKFGKQNVKGIFLQCPEKTKIKRFLEREKEKVKSNRKDFFLEFYRRMLDDLTAFQKVELDPDIEKVYGKTSLENFLKVKGMLAKWGVINE
ncbi:guanylate kinase [Clostridium acetobutylicum]|nr:guanylate kinase [Clostridium acetobutylicum]